MGLQPGPDAVSHEAAASGKASLLMELVGNILQQKEKALNHSKTFVIPVARSLPGVDPIRFWILLELYTTGRPKRIAGADFHPVSSHP